MDFFLKVSGYTLTISYVYGVDGPFMDYLLAKEGDEGDVPFL